VAPSFPQLPPIPKPVLGAVRSWVDLVASRVMERPATVRWRASALDVVQGRAELFTLGLTDLEVGGLVIDRAVLTVHDAHVVPGVPPRVQGGPAEVKATLGQGNLDRWTGRVALPVRLELTPDGIRTRTGIGVFKVSAALTELEVVDGRVRLSPKRAGPLDLPPAIRSLVSGSLPLPSLPPGTRLVRVEHAEGSVSVWLAVDHVDEPLDVGAARRLREELRRY
jgi:hypothetical protein